MATNNLPTTAKAVSADIVVSTMFPTSEEVGQALRSGVRLVIDSDGDGGAGRSLSALEATTIDDVFGMELT